MTDLTPATEEDVTFAIRMSISLDYRGKPRRVNAKMSGAEIDALAQKITEQLKRSNLWPHRGPGAPVRQAPDYSLAWREGDVDPPHKPHNERESRNVIFTLLDSASCVMKMGRDA